MNIVKCKILVFAGLLCLGAIFAAPGFAQVAWRPVTAAELQMKTPLVEADADAEAIFWEVRLDDKKSSKLSFSHYVRVKIYTERGREKFSKFDIPFQKGKKIENVAARVIKSDGSIIELQPSDIFERDIVTVGKLKVKAKSFAVPSIEPGVIVEYQYSETVKDDSLGGESLTFQRDIPMQRVSYYVRPYKGSTVNFTPFNMGDVKFVEDGSGFYIGTMTNVPSLREEPYMPPENQVRSWVYLTYAPFNIANQNFSNLIGWGVFANKYGGLHALMTKPNKKLQKQAAEIVTGATTDEDKLRKIYTYTQTQIKNISYDNSLTEEQIDKIDIDKIEDIIKERAGSAFQVNLLFGALASAAGLNTRLFFSSNRSDIFFDPQKVSSSAFLHSAGIAVNISNQWKYFDPGTPYLAFGDMFWHDQNTSAMLINSDGNFSWVKTPLNSFEQTVTKRNGKFKLLEDGTLEGEVKIEYMGNRAIDRRENGFRDSATAREEEYKAELKERVSVAEVSELSIENFTDATKPLTYIYKVRVPNYAQRTGKRLFLQPGFFEYGENPVFSAAARKYEIFFPYPWSEKDDIEIQLPAGYELENAESPGTVADKSKIGLLDINISIIKAENVLKYTRDFHFGGGNNTLFPTAIYQPLKTLFDSFHKADSQSVTLRQKQ